MLGTMAASSNGDATLGNGANVLDLLAATDSENKRAELVRKHDTLKVKMETLRNERAAQAKQKKAITAALKAAKRARSRIVTKACSLSSDDIVQILCLKNEQEAKKKKKAQAPAPAEAPVPEP